MPRQARHRTRCGQRGQRRDRRRQFADVVQVDVEAGVARRDPSPRGVNPSWSHRRHRSVCSRSRMVSAGCTLRPRPAGDAHLPAGDDRGGQERHRVGQVGLDVPVPGGDRARCHPPPVGHGVVDGDARLAQHRHRHRDVRRRRHRLRRCARRSGRRRTWRPTAAVPRRTATTPTRRSRRCRPRPSRCRARGTAARRRRVRRRGRAARRAAVRSAARGPVRRRRR